MQHPAQILFTSEHPLTSSLDMEFFGVKNHVLEVRVSAPESFADGCFDHEETGEGGTVHSGFTTLFLDTVMGSAVLGELEVLQPIATIKLTNQQHRRARIGEKLVCRARFEGERKDIAFVSAEIRIADSNELIATGVGTFMIGTRSKPLEA